MSSDSTKLTGRETAAELAAMAWRNPSSIAKLRRAHGDRPDPDAPLTERHFTALITRLDNLLGEVRELRGRLTSGAVAADGAAPPVAPDHALPADGDEAVLAQECARAGLTVSDARGTSRLTPLPARRHKLIRALYDNHAWTQSRIARMLRREHGAISHSLTVTT
jgi:hypothetical protein